MSRGAVARIIDFSNVDGPGNRLVVFFQGCNYNCLYCHNPETIPLAGEQAIDPACPPVYQMMTAEDIVKRYMKAKPFISGVTFSGGECTVQLEFLLACCVALKAQGAHILIDTNGQLTVQELDRLLAVSDGLMLDIKAIGPEAHKTLTGADNEAVLRTFRAALLQGKLAEVRTVIRGSEPDALETVAWVARALSASDREVPYRLIRYRPHGVRKAMISRLKPPTEAQMEACRQAAEKEGLTRIITV